MFNVVISFDNDYLNNIINENIEFNFFRVDENVYTMQWFLHSSDNVNINEMISQIVTSFEMSIYNADGVKVFTDKRRVLKLKWTSLLDLLEYSNNIELVSVELLLKCDGGMDSGSN